MVVGSNRFSLNTSLISSYPFLFLFICSRSMWRSIVGDQCVGCTMVPLLRLLRLVFEESMFPECSPAVFLMFPTACWVRASDIFSPF